MSQFIHALNSFANPILNISYEMLQTKNVKTYGGAGAVKGVGQVIESLGYKKPLIVTDRELVRLNLLTEMLESLEGAKLDYKIYDGVEPDPTTAIIDEAVDTFLKNHCDCVISFGGGSSIDTAKVVSGLAKNPSVKNYAGMSKMMSFSLRKGTFPLISIPTTSGTGAEVTMGAVISDTKTHEKGIVIDKNFVAKHVFLDPNLTLGLPPHITAATGFDALVHAIEAYVSKFATEQSNAHSIKAIHSIFKFLPVACENGQNMEARNEMLVASNEAGLAIGRAHIGAVHAIGHNAGAIYKLPHGLIVAMVLPHILEVYLDKCEQKFAEIAYFIGAANPSDQERLAAEKFVKMVWALSEKVGIPKTHEKITKDRFNEIADKAIKESYGYPIPKYVTKEEVLNILDKLAC